MAIERQRWRHWSAALAVGLLCSTGARAEEPPTGADAKRGEPKAVRQIGERGAKVEAKRAGEAAESAAAPAHTREHAGGKLRAAPGATPQGPGHARGEHHGHEPPGLQREPAADAPGAEQGKLTPEERARTREGRSKSARRMRWLALMRHWKRPSEIPPDVRNELRHHARRVARLQRIRALAEEKHDKKTLARCDKLLAHEQERHAKKMEEQSSAQAKLQVGAPPDPTGKPAAAPAPTAAPAREEVDPEAAEAEEQEGAEP